MRFGIFTTLPSVKHLFKVFPRHDVSTVLVVEGGEDSELYRNAFGSTAPGILSEVIVYEGKNRGIEFAGISRAKIFQRYQNHAFS